MTGYGRGNVERDGRQITVEIKSVNHRFLDTSFRMPRSFSFLENDARAQMAARLSRGHVDLFASYRNMREDSKRVEVDGALLAAYQDALDEVQKTTGLADDRSLMGVAQLSGALVVSEAEEDQEALSALFMEALNQAIDGMIVMREREGAAMRADIETRVGRLEEINGRIEARYPQTVEEYAAKLKARVTELLDGVTVDEQRLAQEVALMADRSAIAEETVRLRSHFSQMRELCAKEEPVGRKMDFLVQELNREVNTISSKSQDVPITRLAVEAKAEIEKIREQVQNIE